MTPSTDRCNVLVLLGSRGGKIVHEAWTYEPSEKGRTLAPAPLKSAPGPQDTASATEGVALEYAAALQAQDAAAVAALSAPTIAFADTASGTVGHRPRPGAGPLCKDLHDVVRLEPERHAAPLCLRRRLGGRHFDCERASTLKESLGPEGRMLDPVHRQEELVLTSLPAGAPPGRTSARPGLVRKARR